MTKHSANVYTTNMTEPQKKPTNDLKNRKIGGLYVHKDVNGNKFFSGKIRFRGEDISIIIFKNKNKPESSKFPDWEVFVRRLENEDEDI